MESAFLLNQRHGILRVMLTSPLLSLHGHGLRFAQPKVTLCLRKVTLRVLQGHAFGRRVTLFAPTVTEQEFLPLDRVPCVPSRRIWGTLIALPLRYLSESLIALPLRYFSALCAQNSSVCGSGIGSCFCAFIRLNTLRTPIQIAITGNIRKPISTTESTAATRLAANPIQNVRIR